MEFDTSPILRLNNAESFDNKTQGSLFSSENCRICLNQNPEKLINLCECKGDTKHVHESCLIQWLYEKYSTLENIPCEYCKKEFRIRIVNKYSCEKNYSDLEEYQIYRKGIKAAVILLFVTILWPIATFYFGDHDKYTDFSASFFLSLIPVSCAFAFLMLCLFKIFITINTHYQLPDKDKDKEKDYDEFDYPNY
ncbi:hypothetical protein SteCoe_433 [Stentor coeruleus]|uniref:RING-CH-type domain-containing protein n=1 Tax=Stentor coeruleus TaxID=5963 RepID=A0A1R2D4B0_9CILI|nr:hypothetical protein SteCoe_433 [Stentor coeruleus]